MTWKLIDERSVTGEVWFRRMDNEGQAQEELTPGEMTKYVNDLEDALLLVAADPRMAKLIHKTVKKHVT